jgi:hypothetical protein
MTAMHDAKRMKAAARPRRAVVRGESIRPSEADSAARPVCEWPRPPDWHMPLVVKTMETPPSGCPKPDACSLQHSIYPVSEAGQKPFPAAK